MSPAMMNVGLGRTLMPATQSGGCGLNKTEESVVDENTAQDGCRPVRRCALLPLTP